MTKLAALENVIRRGNYEVRNTANGGILVADQIGGPEFSVLGSFSSPADFIKFLKEIYEVTE